MRAEDTRTLLVVDFKNQVYRASAAHASLFSGRVFTGGVYGFLVSVLRAVRDVRATAVVVATDRPPYRRKAQFAGYKGDRKKDDGDALVMKAAQSMSLLTDLLNVLDVPMWGVEGFEFDDICAWAVDRYSGRYLGGIIAMTNDTDLYQLFDVDPFAVYKGAEKGLYNRKLFEQEFGALTREEWVTFLSMTGTHNAVPGIDGVGPKTALKALRDKVTMRTMLDKHGAIIERNRPLIRLPHADFPEDPGLRIRRHRFEMGDFTRFIARYDIRPTQGMFEALQDLRHIE